VFGEHQLVQGRTEELAQARSQAETALAGYRRRGASCREATAGMSEGRLSGLFWKALDRLAYLLTDTPLRLFDLVYGPEPPTPVDKNI